MRTLLKLVPFAVGMLLIAIAASPLPCKLAIHPTHRTIVQVNSRRLKRGERTLDPTVRRSSKEIYV